MIIVVARKYYIEDCYPCVETFPVEYESIEKLKSDILHFADAYKSQYERWKAQTDILYKANDEIVASQEYRNLFNEFEKTVRYRQNRQRSTPKTQRDDRFEQDLKENEKQQLEIKNKLEVLTAEIYKQLAEVSEVKNVFRVGKASFEMTKWGGDFPMDEYSFYTFDGWVKHLLGESVVVYPAKVKWELAEEETPKKSL